MSVSVVIEVVSKVFSVGQVTVLHTIDSEVRMSKQGTDTEGETEEKF